MRRVLHHEQDRRYRDSSPVQWAPCHIRLAASDRCFSPSDQFPSVPSISEPHIPEITSHGGSGVSGAVGSRYTFRLRRARKHQRAFGAQDTYPVGLCFSVLNAITEVANSRKPYVLSARRGEGRAMSRQFADENLAGWGPLAGAFRRWQAPQFEANQTSPAS